MIVLILGSGLNAIDARAQPRGAIDRILAINNAWKIRADWDVLIHPEDFPATRHPTSRGPGQEIVTASDYVPVQNTMGGFVYAGGTMAFTAGYWALGALRPRVLAFLGCDMVYPAIGPTHFYGTGDPDPLREDVTLRSLEAKSARLMIHAARQGCATVNLSRDDSRLIFPRASWERLAEARPQRFDPATVVMAEAKEAALGYQVPSGRYWEEEDRFDPLEIDALDALWLSAAQPAMSESGAR